MSGRINNNIEAIDTLRNLTTAQSMFSTSIARLSSGKRINSAADDAAGYAISQKLMAQSNGLNQAYSNAQNGISMVQTASGGLTTTQQLLQRMRQLAVQSANDTNTSSDRTALQLEANQITAEISQIASTTQFNGKNLLDGTLGASGAVTSIISGLSGVTTASTVTNAGSLASGLYSFNATTVGTKASIAAVGSRDASTALTDFIGNAGYSTDSTATDVLGAAGALNLTITGGAGSATIALTAAAGSGDTFQNVLDKINAQTTTTGVTAAYNTSIGFTLTGANYGSGQSVTATGQDKLLKGLGLLTASTATAAATTTVESSAGAGTDGAGTLTLVGGASSTLRVAGDVFTESNSGFTYDLSALGGSLTTGTMDLTISANGANLQVGANGGQNINVAFADMRSKALAVQVSTESDNLGTTAIDISSTSTAASNAISTIDAAIQSVSSQAATLGAVQNRLTAAMNNLAIGAQNMTAAYSTITNVNMAQETTNLATAQILQQSATSMLAQANQAPQGVLKLLG